jgi:hypothetical protein
MKRYPNFWKSVKQSGGVTSAIKHGAVVCEDHEQERAEQRGAPDD